MQTYSKNMWCNYQKTWSNSWCCSVDKRLTSGWKQPVHLIIENTAVVSYSQLWQNEVIHTHSVYNPFLDSGIWWLTPARMEQFVQHWHSAITYSDNNKKACLIIYSNLEIVVQTLRIFTSHVPYWKGCSTTEVIFRWVEGILYSGQIRCLVAEMMV